MEPAAPGTEEDVPVVPANFKKKEHEQERLLSIKAKLPKGRYGNVFEHSIVNGSEFWYCNLCVCPIMGRIYHHEIGRRHTSNMQAYGDYSEEPEPDENEDPEPILQIAPGEPAPPGFEDSIEKVAVIQSRLDSFATDPLIGLEYLFELTEYGGEKEPSFLCTLCDKRGDPRTVISHLASYNHITQYLQRHFLKCYQALSPFLTKQYKRNWQAAMHKIAEAIEAKYGRLKPHVVDKDVFERKRAAYLALVVRGPHFTQRAGLTFEEMVVQEDLTRTIQDDSSVIKQAEENVKKIYTNMDAKNPENSRRSPSPPVVAKPKKRKAAPLSGERRKSLSSVSSISSSDLSDFEPNMVTSNKDKKIKQDQPTEERNKQKNFPNKPQFRRQKQSPLIIKRPNERPDAHVESPRNKLNNERGNKNRFELPWQRPDYRSRAEKTLPVRAAPKFDKHAEFKKLATAIEKDMERVLKLHEKNPEKHPQYNDEWKKFWNQRYKELQCEGKNPAGHDFKPEWIEFWNKRLKDIHGSEIKAKKDALRKRLGLPEEPAPICFRITGKKKPNQKEDGKDTKLAPMASTPDHDPDVIIIEDKETEVITIDPKRRSNSPWEKESSRVPRRAANKRSRSRDRRRSPSDTRRRSRSDSRSRSRGRRSRSREHEWQSRDPYREYTREKLYYRSEYPEYIKPPRLLRDVTRHPVNSPPMQHIKQDPEPASDEDGEVNIVGVLRLLTAVEEKLGSLGPKVIDLLSQALAMEKTEANSSEALLDSDNNCVMFETVKEKLKGQLLAGLVNYAQEKAFKKAIKKIASIIHYAGERKKQREIEKPKSDPIKVPGVGAVDKSAIAKQIAAALIVQGKTDVTQNELEQLINAVVGMAEASQASNKPMTTASFLQQLTQPKPVHGDKSEPSADLFQIANQIEPEPASSNITSNMEGLSDSDLQTLLQNFKDLCTEEQHSLISYLKKLEAREPERVERLRKFVNLEAPAALEKETEIVFEKSDEETNGKVSPFSVRYPGANPSGDDKYRNKFEHGDKPKTVDKINIESDDEDYSFEDVCKAANKNVRDKEEKEEQERLLAKSASVLKNEFNLFSAKSIIANLMGQFKSKVEAPQPLVVPPPKPPAVPLFPNFPNPNILDNIPVNMANLTNALNTAQQNKLNTPHIIPPKPIPPQIIPPHLIQPLINPMQLNLPQMQIQQQVSNPNSFSLHAHSHPDDCNPNPNNFSLQSRPHQNQSYPHQRSQYPESRVQVIGNNIFEPPSPSRHNQFQGEFMGGHPQHDNFNRPGQPRPDQFSGHRPEYFDNYGRW